MRPASFGGVLLSLVFAASSCSSTDPPVDGNLRVDFPNVAAAVSVDKMQVYVFDATGDPNLCQALVPARSSSTQFPAQLNQHPLVQLGAKPAFPVCDIVNAPGSLKLPEVSFGDRAVVVVGTGGNIDRLIGCQHVTLGEGNLDRPLILRFIANTDLPATTCRSLAERCGGGC